MKHCRYMTTGKRWRSGWWWHSPDTSTRGYSLRKLIHQLLIFPTTSILSRIPWTLDKSRVSWRIRATGQSWISLQIWNWFSIIANYTMVRALMSAAWESKLERTTFVFASSTVSISISSRCLKNCRMLDTLLFVCSIFPVMHFKAHSFWNFKL